VVRAISLFDHYHGRPALPNRQRRHGVPDSIYCRHLCYPGKDVLSPEQVIVHEFGHGYWYGLVASNEFEEAWLDEGINTYSTGKVTDLAYGPGRLPLRFNGLPLSWLIKPPAIYDWQLGRVVSTPFATLDPIVTESWKFYNSVSYSMNVYYRAPPVSILWSDC